jgi:integrase
MPKVALTDRFVSHAKAQGVPQLDYFDEGVPGLALRVSSTGRKTWTFHYTSPGDGKRARLTLGTYPATTLANARGLATEARGSVEAGNDPRTRTSGAMTVAALVQSYVEKHVAPLRTATEIERRIRKNIVPVIGTVKLADFHRRDVNRCVDPIVKRGSPIEAARAFEDLRAMLRWAVSRGDLDHNPIDGMKKPATSKPRERVLSEDEILALWMGLPTALANTPTCQRIIKLCLITGQRVGEVAGMRRGELDLKHALWSLPGSRTKNGHPHAVPLSDVAIGIIEEALADGDGTFVFPSDDSASGTVPPRSIAKTLLHALKPTKEYQKGRLGLTPFTPHDLRRTALTGMAKLGVAPIVIGHVANHRTTTKAGMTLAVYIQHQYEREKREALELWADRLAGIIGGGAEVVAIGGRAR